MKSTKAIEILKKQKEDLKEININTYESWRSQTASYIKAFLGQTNEYLLIKDKGVVGFYKTNEECENKIKEFSITLDDLLKRCIETVENIGLRKDGNLFTRISDKWLIVIIPALVTVLLTCGTLWGKYLSDIQNIELKRELKSLKDSLGKTSSTNVSTNNQSHKTTDSTSK